MHDKRRHWLRGCYKEVREHPLILAALVVGCTMGLLLRLPLIPWRLDESSATVIGSAIGALMAVSTAAWMARMTLTREERNVRQILIVLLYEVTRTSRSLFDKADSIEKLTDRVTRIATCSGMLRYQEALYETAQRAGKRLEVLVTVGRVEVSLSIFAADAQVCIRKHLPVLETLAAEAKRGVAGIPESAYAGHVCYLHDQLDDFSAEMDFILNALTNNFAQIALSPKKQRNKGAEEIIYR